MSFETDKRKLRKIWDGGVNNANSIESATLIQGAKQTQVKLSQPSSVQFSNFTTLNSEWMSVMPKGIQNDGSYSYRSVEFTVELTLPEKWVPYARLNLAYRRMDNASIFAGSSITYNQFCNIIDATPKDPFGLTRGIPLKKVTWNVSFSQNNYTSTWYDYEMKLFFTLINPAYMTVS